MYVKHEQSSVPVSFIVADMDSQPIVGLKTSMNLNLIKRINKIKNSNLQLPGYLNEFNDCFDEIGCLHKTHHIVTDPNVQPVINPPQRLPISLYDKLHKEIQRMVKLNVIVPVQEPTEWVNSLVAVEKPDNTLRICIDPRDLNKAVKRPHYNLPTTEEILARMSNAKYLTELDASCAYWQIPR